VIKIARAVKEVNIGEMVEAIVTDPAIHADIPAWCRTTGHELVKLENQGAVVQVIVRRTK
jgi:tRNA 2-thiouridine synthesizing protein A